MISQSLDMIAQSLDMIAQSLDMIAQSLNDICVPVCTMHVLMEHCISNGVIHTCTYMYNYICMYMYVHVCISCIALCAFPPVSVSRATEGQSQPPSEEQPMEH